MEETNFTNQNPQPAQNFNPQFGQMPLPNSGAVLTLGIISIALCWCYGVVALTCGIIALVLANKSLVLYKANPNNYTLSSYNNLKAGRVCSIIGLCLSALMLIYVIIVVAFIGAAFSAMPWEMMSRH
ncbi:MAG: CCC motif membrane protein [Bacteroidota bacterium]